MPDRVSLFDNLLEIAQYMNGLPETALTFNLSDAVTENANHITDEHLWPLNTWEIPPERFTGTNRSRRLVNPEHPDAPQYSDCFAVVSFSKVLSSPRDIKREDAYSEIARARSALREKRVEWVKKCALNNLTGERAQIRCGFDTLDGFWSFVRRQDIQYKDLRLRGRDKIVDEWRRLSDAGYSYRQIGLVYHAPKGTVSRHIHDDSIGSPKTLKGVGD